MELNWIKLSEQKPTANKHYLCFWKADENHKGFIIALWDNDWIPAWNDNTGRVAVITHWQEMEEPNK